METQSNEGNFLDLLRAKLENHGMLAAVNDPQVKALTEEVIPAWLTEFAGYIGSVQIPVLNEPQDFKKAQEASALLQRQLDRLTYCYVTHLRMYQNLNHAKSLASYYVQVEVNEVKALKNAEMRSAAINYVLDDFSEVLGELDQLYDTITQVRNHIEKANLSLNMQMRLLEGAANLKHGSSRSLGGAS